MSNFREVVIQCKDGIQLAGTFYSAIHPKGAVLIAPATGIRKRFYHAFAEFLAHNHYHVLTFENRGIGDSKGNNLNRVDATLVNWGKLDMTAALETLKENAPDLPYHLIGHSAGGQLVGLMDNAHEIQSMFNFASSSGSLRNMSYPFKLGAWFFLNIYIPFNNLLFGQTNSQWVGMGEPLPKKVASQWSKWCNGSGYIHTELNKTIKAHHYNELSFPSLWLHATDDGIANLKNVEDMVRVFPALKTDIVTLVPAELGFKDIGHMKFFSSKRKVLWKYALDWLGNQQIHAPHPSKDTDGYSYTSSVNFIDCLQFDYVETYSFRRRTETGQDKQDERKEVLDRLNEDQQYLFTSNGKLHPSAQKTGTFQVEHKIVNQLVEILQTEIKDVPQWMCAPIYRDAIVFYNSKNEIQATLNICLSCEYMETSKFQFINADTKAYQLFRQFFINLGHQVED